MIAPVSQTTPERPPFAECPRAGISKFRSIDSESSDPYDQGLSERLPVSVAQLDRASASEAEVTEFEVVTCQELRQPAIPVAPVVAPAKPKADETGPGETDFTAALLMLATLPLSNEERAEAVRRLLAGR